MTKDNTYDDKTGYLTMNDPVVNPGTTLYPYTKKDKPEAGKTYALTGTKNDKCILNGNTWKESEVKKDSFDTIDHLEKRMLLNEQMEDN
tara:strand:+ start:390 stop:656 length:267 start_codon:yes stop_codon:yes gene_type:complete